ncbi:hypothetical protein GW17_00020814 [Ensete ventricosum]|nr:hypothetical protein GW17_00020814 [Ensete ventricosum]
MSSQSNKDRNFIADLTRKESQRDGTVTLRRRRRPEEAVLTEGLEGEAAEEPGDAGATGVPVARTVVDVHNAHEHGDVSPTIRGTIHDVHARPAKAPGS